jgi:hypothetical protein
VKRKGCNPKGFEKSLLAREAKVASAKNPAALRWYGYFSGFNEQKGLVLMQLV